jgi:hypothetical protein
MRSISTIVLACLGVAGGLGLWADPIRAETCVVKAGSATGVTRDFAEYEAFLIIRQVTGNWPFQSDRISEPAYDCKQGTILWTCNAKAKVCKG